MPAVALKTLGPMLVRAGKERFDHQNFHGIKYRQDSNTCLRPGRSGTFNHAFQDGSKEQQ
jgi:hypothetical protein